MIRWNYQWFRNNFTLIGIVLIYLWLQNMAYFGCSDLEIPLLKKLHFLNRWVCNMRNSSGPGCCISSRQVSCFSHCVFSVLGTGLLFQSTSLIEHMHQLFFIDCHEHKCTIAIKFKKCSPLHFFHELGYTCKNINKYNEIMLSKICILDFWRQQRSPAILLFFSYNSLLLI